MENALFHVLSFIVGTCIGSFLCCQARRLHYNLAHKRAKLKSKRSICLRCKKPLKWHDNIPLLSWVMLRGKCRYCHHKIGIAEIISEIATAIAFLSLSFTVSITSVSPFEWLIFISVIVFTSVLVFLAIYDGLYGELPTLFLLIAIFIGFIIASLKIWSVLIISPFTPDLIVNPLLSVLVLGGLYLLLYLLSKGKWVGDGDWLLASAIALALGHPLLALIALFLANFVACLIMLPVAKGNHKAKIHFGPFLVIAFVITYILSPFFIMLMLQS